MNKGQLIAKIAEAAGISKSTSGTVLTSIIATITKTVKKEGKITISGFGTFTKVKRKARKGRNPRTGEAVKIKATATVRFKASKAVKEIL